MARKRSSGARYNLGEPYDQMLADFCAANFDAPAIEVMRNALKAFINSEIEKNPSIKERYDQAQKERLSDLPVNVSPIKKPAANSPSSSD